MLFMSRAVKLNTCNFITLHDVRPPLQAASTYVEAVDKYDVDEDKLLSVQLGMDPESDLFKDYKDKVKKKLRDRAEELKRAEREQPGRQNYELGQKAYERGMYPQSVKYFTAALDETGPFSKLGGEVQLWLALAYQATGQGEECLQLYRTLETTHPLPQIRKQAADLRYIMEAPELEIGEDEKIKIPVLDLEKNAARGNVAIKPRPRGAKRDYKPSLEEQFLSNYRPPIYKINKYVWYAAAGVSVLLAYMSSVYK
jgi:tetratricopeptide (TPR) repeat protein